MKTKNPSFATKPLKRASPGQQVVYGASKITAIIFLAILALACFFRFWQIRSLPAGLYSDEGANGLDVLDILSGKNISVFYERNYGREGLYFYLLALAVKLFGVGVWQIKIVSGIINILTIIGLYLLGRELFKPSIALLASFFAAISLPATVLSRVAFRANLIPLILVFLFYFAARALHHQKNQYLYSFLAGTFLGLGFYTYISFRVVPFLILGLLILAEISSRRTSNLSFLKLHYKKILTAFIAFLITIAPIAIYFTQYPESFWGRSGDVSILNPNLPHSPFYYLARNIALTLIMFNAYGDANWRHNISGNPFFDPVTGILFLMGIIASLFIFFKAGSLVLGKKDRSFQKTFLVNSTILAWLGIMLGPMIISEEGIPHFLRSIGIMPIIFLFPALGLYFLFLKIRYRPVIISFLLLTVVVFAVNYNLWLYFKVAKNAYGYYSSYYGDLTPVSDYINKNNKRNLTFLVLDDKADHTTRFLTSTKDNPYILVKPEEVNQQAYPANSKIIFPSLSFGQVGKFQQAFPKNRLIYEQYNQFGEKAMEVYTIQLKVQN